MAAPTTEVALAGPDGQRAADLLGRAKQAGTDLLARLTEQALTRLLSLPDPLAHPVLFNDDELAQLAASFASTIATADLLGRSRIRQHAAQVQKFAEDARGDEHAPAGSPDGGEYTGKGGAGGSSGTDAPAKAGHLAKLASMAASVPAMVKAKVGAFVKAKYAKLTARYGPAGAKAVLGACVLLTPIPLPGTTFIPIALAEAVRTIRHAGHFAEEPNNLAAEVYETLKQLYDQAGEKMPELTAEDVEKAIQESTAKFGEIHKFGNWLETLENIADLAKFLQPEDASVPTAHDALPDEDDFDNLSKLDDSQQQQQQQPPGPPDPFALFPEPIPPLIPERAVSYFQALIPTLGTDVMRYGPQLERHAFTLAVATDAVMLDKVKVAIKSRLEGSLPVSTATADIQDILNLAGVAPANPQYAEMVYRTNMMDAYNTGQVAELADPVMQEFFPVWRYDGILDSRTGDDHRPHIGLYYPSSAIFADVRGSRIYNCRCSFTPINKYDWAELVGRGARLETAWPALAS